MTTTALATAMSACSAAGDAESWKPHGKSPHRLSSLGADGAMPKSGPNAAATAPCTNVSAIPSRRTSIANAPARRQKSTRSTGFASGWTKAAASPASPPASARAASRSSRETSARPAAVARASPAAWRWLMSSYVTPARSGSPSECRARMRRTVASSQARASVVICMISFSFQEPRDRARVLLPFLRECRSVLATARGDAVVLPRRHARLDLAPAARDVALGFERVERGVDVPLRHLERALRALADRRDDLVAVPLPLARELEDGEARASLADLLRPSVHVLRHGCTYDT